MSVVVCTTLYRVPTVDDYAGVSSFAFINPRLVSSMVPDTATEVGSEAGKERDITGTRVTTSEEVFFVPLTVSETAGRLHITLEGLEDAATEAYA